MDSSARLATLSTSVGSSAESRWHAEHWSEFKSGGHFPAMDASELLVDDVRKFFHDLR